MINKIGFYTLCTIVFINSSLAQDEFNFDMKFDLHFTVPNHIDLKQKYDFGGGGNLGASFYLPWINTYVIPRIGIDVIPRNVGEDDTYKEDIIFNNGGVELMYRIFSSDDLELLPFVGIDQKSVVDRYFISNGNIIQNSNGTTNLSYDKQPPIFASSAVASSFGLESRINKFFIKIAYEIYKVEVTPDLEHSYDEIDQEIYKTPVQILNLSTVKFGIGVYVF